MSHKSEATGKDCQCDSCELRFKCFTEERVFSSAAYQAMFEALMALGKTREEALESVINEIRAGEWSKQIPASPQIDIYPTTPPYVAPGTQWIYPTWLPSTQQQWTDHSSGTTGTTWSINADYLGLCDPQKRDSSHRGGR
jgi:hypothetical protein